MNLKDMITFGSVVKFRDGRLAVALRDLDPLKSNIYVFYGLNNTLTSTVNKNGIISLNAYDDCLNNKEGGVLSRYDIMAITNPNFGHHSCGGSRIAAELIKVMFGFVSEEDIHWDWKREDVIEVTMEAVEEKFGCKVKIVKEEK